MYDAVYLSCEVGHFFMDIYREQPLHPATSGHWRNDSFDTSEFAGTGVKGGINPTTLLPHSGFFLYL